VRTLALACGLVVLANLGMARADGTQPTEEAILIKYDGPPECTTESAFFAQVAARTPRARLAASDARVRAFMVSLTRGSEASFGRLVMRAPDGAESERDVTGDTCDEVVSALALVCALAVDPQASTRRLPAPPPPPPSPPPVVTFPPLAPVLGTPPTPDKPVASSADTLRREARRWHLALTLDASLVGGISPSPLFGTPVTVEADLPAGHGLAPTMRLGFERASSGGGTGPTALFTLTIGIFEACPRRWQLGPVRLEPVCLRVEGGAVEGVGANVIPSHDLTRGWVALGAVARAEWAFWKPLFLDLEGGVRFPLVRPTYVVEPETTVYPVPVVAGVVTGGLGVRFL
jgi:hypothetical protein